MRKEKNSRKFIINSRNSGITLIALIITIKIQE